MYFNVSSRTHLGIWMVCSTQLGTVYIDGQNPAPPCMQPWKDGIKEINMDKLPINRCRISANSRTVSSKTVIPSVRPFFEPSCFTDNIPHLWTTQFAECKGLSHLQGLQLILYQQPRARMIEDGSKFKLWVFEIPWGCLFMLVPQTLKTSHKAVLGSSGFSKYTEHQSGIKCILWYSMAWPMSFGSSKRQKWVLGRCSSKRFCRHFPTKEVLGV